jgi:hypothetical protein
MMVSYGVKEEGMQAVKLFFCAVVAGPLPAK